MAALAVLVGALVSASDAATLREGATIARVAAGALAAFAFAAAGNVRNDMFDVELDRVAHPRRPLVTGALSRRGALALAVALYGVSLAGAAFLGPWTLALVLGALALMEGYERALKAQGFVGNLAVGALTGVPFVVGSIAVGSLGVTALALAGLATLTTVGREILKDVEDAEADRAFRRTFPQRVGRAQAALVAGAFLLAGVALSPLPFVLESVLGWPYLALIALADALFVAAALRARVDAARAQRLAKFAMFVALVAFAVGRWTLLEGLAA